MELTSQSNQFVLTERCQTVGLLNVWKRNSKNILMETRDRAESKYKRAFMNCFSVLLDLDVKDSEGRYIEFFQRYFTVYNIVQKYHLAGWKIHQLTVEVSRDTVPVIRCSVLCLCSRYGGQTFHCSFPLSISSLLPPSKSTFYWVKSMKFYDNPG